MNYSRRIKVRIEIVLDLKAKLRNKRLKITPSTKSLLYDWLSLYEKSLFQSMSFNTVCLTDLDMNLKQSLVCASQVAPRDEGRIYSLFTPLTTLINEDF
jgi:hypothetical protein